MNEVGFRFPELSSSGIESPRPPLQSEPIFGRKFLNEQRTNELVWFWLENPLAKPHL